MKAPKAVAFADPQAVGCAMAAEGDAADLRAPLFIAELAKIRLDGTLVVSLRDAGQRLSAGLGNIGQHHAGANAQTAESAR